MQIHKPLLNLDKFEISQQSSRKTLQSRSITPLTSNKNLSNERKHQKFPVRVEYRKSSTPIPRQEPPYVMMRNGTTFLYTPGQSSQVQPDVVSPFGTSLRGFKIRGRPERGNMFAVHTGERLSPNIILKPRSYLNMRSKWK